MNLLTVEGLTKTFGEKKVFENITFGIDAGDKIGVIGINGTGKSTLLKIIAGVETADSGNIVKMNGLRIGYLPQTPDYDPKDTVLGQVFNSDNPVIRSMNRQSEPLSWAKRTQRKSSMRLMTKWMRQMHGILKVMPKRFLQS